MTCKYIIGLNEYSLKLASVRNGVNGFETSDRFSGLVGLTDEVFND